MSEHCKEQYPLLCEDLSDEERFSPRHLRRYPMNSKSRAKYHLRGAAALLKRWPDHWSSFLAYWWVGIGMISLTTYILYNSIFSVSLLSTVNLKPTKPLYPTSNPVNESSKKSVMPDVYMHEFYSSNEKIDLSNYLPYIKNLAKKFPNFKYNFVVVINDTNISTESNEIDPEEINHMALNDLWSKDITYSKITKVQDINLKYITLSKVMDSSPLRRYWRNLSNEVIEFLLRTLSIWEKGGIVFNPSIIKHNSLKEAYSEKLFNILQTYDINDNGNSKNIKIEPKKIKLKKRVNNIRDVIEDLEDEEDSKNYVENTLAEAENKLYKTEVIKIRKSRSAEYKSSTHSTLNLNTTILSPNVILNSTTNNIKNESLRQNYVNKNNRSNSLYMLPSFLKYIFRGYPYNNSVEETPVFKLEITTENDIKLNNIFNMDRHDYKTKTLYSNSITKAEHTNEIESITSNHIKQDSGIHFPHKSQEQGVHPEKNHLIIDLKGNIIATKTPCHVFLGTLYSNVIHHPKPITLTNFLISELSTFCKGLLTSCVGIDLILV